MYFFLESSLLESTFLAIAIFAVVSASSERIRSGGKEENINSAGRRSGWNREVP